MDTAEILHLLRNPFGRNPDLLTAARLAAADLIERRTLNGERYEFFRSTHLQETILRRAMEMVSETVNDSQALDQVIDEAISAAKKVGRTTRIEELQAEIDKLVGEDYPPNCKHGMVLKNHLAVPKSCPRCGLGPCPYRAGNR